jgi:hypothetical protein
VEFHPLQEFVQRCDRLEQFNKIFLPVSLLCRSSLYTDQSAIRYLAPGGIYEFQDLDFQIQSQLDGFDVGASVLGGFFNLLSMAYGHFGIDLQASSSIPRRLKDAGFKNVTAQLFQIPVGHWPKEKKMKTLGAYFRCWLTGSLEGLTNRAFSEGLEWSNEKLLLYLQEVRNALQTINSQQLYVELHVVYGTKPAES